MWLNVILLLIAFIVLLKCSSVFVDSVSSIATNLKVPKMLVALTIAAFGTCTPELAISFNSIFTNNGDMAIANVLGSNITNILLIIGLAAAIFPIKIKSETEKKQLPLLIIITSIFSITLISNIIGKEKYIINWSEALVLLTIFCAFIAYIISLGKLSHKTENSKSKYSTKKSIIYTIITIGLIIISSNMVVDNAVSISEHLKISQKVITMTVIVIGTSLPELITTIIASKKKEFDIAIGNIIGTNIFNIGVVLGLPILLKGGVSSSSFNILDAIIVLFSSVILYLFSKNDRTLSRREGILMVLVFITYYAVMIII